LGVLDMPSQVVAEHAHASDEHVVIGPAGRTLHVPAEAPPHVSHAPSHALSQQTPWLQWPVAQASSALQLAPCMAAQRPPTHTFAPAQSSLLVHVLGPQAAPSQTLAGAQVY
jgi:hypothetical protein